MAENTKKAHSHISRLFGFGLLALGVGAVCAIGFLGFVTLGSDELRSKHEWSCLQILEQEWRDEAAEGYPMLQQRLGYHVACVPSADGKQKIWILLTPKFEPHYKQMPSDVDYQLTGSELKAIAEHCSVHPSVMAELRRRTF